jgi:Tfp pilus assembly protein PilF
MMTRPFARSRSARLLATSSLLASTLLAACNKNDAPAADSAAATPAASAAVTDESLMTRGLDEMNRAGNGAAAVATFREVLSRNPTHYGAHYQLAKAFDVAGQPDSARVWWTKVASMAEANKDTASIAAAKARLAQPDTVSQAAMMNTGLSLMNGQNQPDSAAAVFRAVLKRNPTHYGATYQLAQALDKAGKRAEAHEVWIKVLGMAEANKDQPSIDAARARLKSNP